MSDRFRSSSLGAVPRKNPLSRSRAESSHTSPLEVRCACQFFQSDSLIPERINPIGSRPPSRVGPLIEGNTLCSKHSIVASTVVEEDLTGSALSFGKNPVRDYYGETNETYHPQISSQEFCPIISANGKPFSPIPLSSIENLRQTIALETSIPSISIQTFKRESEPRIIPFNNHTNIMKGQFSSQKSLDKYSTSVLLSKYRPKSKSQAPSLQNSTVDIRLASKMTKTVSFDYGKTSQTLQAGENPNYDQYHRMSPMVFPVHERLQNVERISVTR